MRAVLQRVSSARVDVLPGIEEGKEKKAARPAAPLGGKECAGEIAEGLVVLVGVCRGDSASDLEWMSRKITGLRIFPDENGKMNRSVADVGGKVLMVSQFTVCAEVTKGTRPSFGRAMEPVAAAEVFQELVARVSEWIPVETGRFQATMEVALVNQGPVTIWLDSQRRAS